MFIIILVKVIQQIINVSMHVAPQLSGQANSSAFHNLLVVLSDYTSPAILSFFVPM